ncbi:hypothetical protein SNE40_011786 [Patella caerulea]|uniref:protein-tyrosine-phosphatase n=1 Tax=Patella caerulea TaxID=87958 RepID=A0AAN8JM52_PATCE
MTGNCSLGCIAGKKGNYCSENCSAGYYGENCANTCGRCARGTPCNTTSGSCGPVGCEDGFIGLMCSQAASKTDGTHPAVVAVLVILAILLCAILAVVGVKMSKRYIKDNQQPIVTPVPIAGSPLETDSENETDDADEGSNDVVMYSNLPNSGVYENLPSTRIELKKLSDIIQRKKTAKTFKPEFENLPKGLCSPHDVCLNEINRPKNRYKGICAFDHTRVKLEIENNDPTSDYVNACYITGYGNTKNKYIASQGPNDVNINEFMRLIWDVKTGKIVMVTNPQELGVIKCLEYWPIDGKTKSFKKISVKLLAEDIFAHFTIRTLKINKEGCDPRTIKHFHYTSWPDKGVPADAASLVEFRNKVNKSSTPHPGPMIVHCSAGIGRTGTYLTLDYLIEEGKAEGSVDVVKCISRMRTERVNMVQTLDQYVFLHEAILEWYIAGNITTSIADYKTEYQNLLKRPTSGKCLLEQKFKMLKKVSPVHSEDDYYSALLDENRNKNRSVSILASESVRPFLSSSGDNATDYINAVYISSYRKKQAYILTQTPLPNTVIDFWKMVIQTESYIIVDLDHGQEISKDIGQYLPETKLMYYDYYVTKSDDIQYEDDYSIATYKIGSDIDENVNQTVKVYKCKFWNDQQQTPESLHSLINVLEHVKSNNDNSNPLTVVCRDGVTKGGIFCVLGAILERLTIEQEVSVLQTILQLRASRPQIITSYEQLKFCFEAIKVYLENYTTYVNIL